jgi:hypothetical protein
VLTIVLAAAIGCGAEQTGEPTRQPVADPAPAGEAPGTTPTDTAATADEEAATWRAAAQAVCSEAGAEVRDRLAVLEQAEAEFFERQDPASAQVHLTAYTDAAGALAVFARGLEAIEPPPSIRSTVADLAHNLELAVIIGESLGRGGEDRLGEGQLDFDDRVRMSRDGLRELGLPDCF